VLYFTLLAEKVYVMISSLQSLQETLTGHIDCYNAVLYRIPDVVSCKQHRSSIYAAASVITRFSFVSGFRLYDSRFYYSFLSPASHFMAS